jgi:4-hydroxy-tetrahydrodipicolinate synthase
LIKGSIVALITPFLENGDLDVKSFRRLIHLQMEQGTTGLVIAGTTGESSTLSIEELEILIEAAVREVQGKIPVIAGVGTNDTRLSVEKTLRAKKLGADLCLVVFPYYNKPMFEGCFAHFEAISQCNLPMILYYHPGRTGVHLSSIELAQICSLPSVAALKDCSGSLKMALEVQQISQKLLFAGDDSFTLPLIEKGAEGVISVLGNLLPYEWNQMVKAALSGEYEKARAQYRKLEPLCQAMGLETNPQCIKYAVSLLGYCAPVFRLPLTLPQASTRLRIEEELRSLRKEERLKRVF